MLQFHIVLLKFGEVVFKRGRIVSSCANPLGIYSYVRTNQKPSKVPCQSTTDDGLLASMHGPILGTGVICHAKHHRVRIGGNLALKDSSDGCTVVDDDRHIFKTVNSNELVGFIVFQMQ
jgi:hypothetical protein